MPFGCFSDYNPKSCHNVLAVTVLPGSLAAFFTIDTNFALYGLLPVVWLITFTDVPSLERASTNCKSAFPDFELGSTCILIVVIEVLLICKVSAYWIFLAMVERIINNKWLVLVVLVYDIYNVIISIIGTDMDHLPVDWFGIGIKVFMCVVIIALLRHVQRLQEMLLVHRAVSLYRNRNLLLNAVDTDEADEVNIMNNAIQAEIKQVRRYLLDKYPEKTGRQIDDLLDSYYRGKGV